MSKIARFLRLFVVDDYVAFGDAVDQQPAERRLAQLLAVSVLGLFLEVCLIRWHGTEFRAAAFFKNISLLACFLGLGLGFSIADRKKTYFALTLPLLFLHLFVFGLLSQLGVDRIIRFPETGSANLFWGVESIQGGNAVLLIVQYVIFYGFFLALFVTTMLVFIPIGQLTGRLMKSFPPIEAYSINIGGSIVGVLLFTLVSFLWLPPVVWFAVTALLACYLLRPSRENLARSVPIVLAMVVWVGVDWVQIVEPNDLTMQHVYSPYQHLELSPIYVLDDTGTWLERGMEAFANKSYHLSATDLSKKWVDAHSEHYDWLRERAQAYNLPYAFSPDADSILVLGAGAGNDVAAAVRNTSPQCHIDAVEIDPAIIAFGQNHHPERPYVSPQVTVHVGDARHFLSHAQSKYDLIVFGLIDSHTLLTGMSNLRLEYFVYTRESFIAARNALRDGGNLAVSFCAKPDAAVTLRLYHMLKELFPTVRAFYIGADGGTVFIAGPSVTRPVSLPQPVLKAEVTRAMQARPQDAFPPDTTDDWPFLYLAKRAVPGSCIWLLLLLGGVSALWVRVSARNEFRFNAHFFLLGAAFLLIETKGITELALVWGTTWLVNSVVITAVLIFILLANAYVERRTPARVWPYYIGLAVTLVAGYLYSVDSMLSVSWSFAAVTSGFLLFAPLFFAGVVFAISLKAVGSIPEVFASNLLGAIVGALCEYSSMALGFRAMYLVALALYAGSYLALRRRPVAA